LRAVVFVIGLAIASCNSSAASSEGETSLKGSKLLALELARCPLWTEVPGKDVVARKRITHAYEGLAHYDNATIRTGISLYLQSFASFSWENYKAGEKIFAFLRVVFEVPRRFDATKGGLPYGILGNPVHSDGVDLLWPFSLEHDGQLALTGVDLVFHSGPPYDPIADFDQMASRLERRFPVSQ
jgi:hypothetical protein